MSQPDPAFEAAKTLFFDGLAHYEAGRFSEAEACFAESLQHVPGRVTTLINLAAVRLRLGRADDALAAADAVLATEPNNADGWLHRAGALTLLARHEDSLAASDRLLALVPTQPSFWVMRGQTLECLARNDEALAAYDRTLALDATRAFAWSRRGELLRETHRLEEAAHAYEQAIAHGADDALHRYYLAAVRGEASASAPRAYVEGLFDDYAGEFDEHLRALGYRAPEQLAREVEAAVGKRHFNAALDLGCGTGLCGPWMKQRATHLSGVDLSQPMLDQARALGVYDTLAQADITEHLQVGEPCLDLIVSADVFIYVGELGAVFELAARALHAGGVFAFSAERAPDGVSGVVLQPSLRYAHSADYLLGLAQAHGFEVLRSVQAPIREDQRESIAGLYLVLRRSAA